jgi:hypothetical protein
MIPAILLREESDDRRGAERWRIRLGARRLDSKNSDQLLTILDLSSTGILLETDQPLGPGTHLIIEMAGDVIKICKTVWNSGKFHGATFSEPLTDAELRDLIGASSVVWPKFREETQAASIEPPSQTLPENLADHRVDKDEKYPAGIRLMIIIGITAALWTLIGVGIWLALR